MCRVSPLLMLNSYPFFVETTQLFSVFVLTLTDSVTFHPTCYASLRTSQYDSCWPASYTLRLFWAGMKAGLLPQLGTCDLWLVDEVMTVYARYKPMFECPPIEGYEPMKIDPSVPMERFGTKRVMETYQSGRAFVAALFPPSSCMVYCRMKFCFQSITHVVML